jgi:hypothetical protein
MTSYRDWVVETSSTTGTGTYNLSGSAPAGTSYFTFRQRYSNGETDVVYWVVNADRTKWEKNRFGTLTYGTPDTLTRNVVESTNGDAPVSWVGGDLPLRLYVTQDSSAAEAGLNAFAFIKVTVFTGSGTFTPDPDMIECMLEAIGGGGAGGGIGGLAGSSVGGGGGGSGGYSRTHATAADIGASKTVTIGAGGTGVSNAAGNNGGDTSVGSLCIGKGGSGGSPAGTVTGGLGGVAGTGDFTPTGMPGGNGVQQGGVTTFGGTGGDGGSSHYGGGGRGAYAAGSVVAGGGATAYGGGGGGAAGNNSAADVAGGNGFAGVVIVTEYCKVAL